jgi:GntR family transcriptional regulator
VTSSSRNPTAARCTCRSWNRSSSASPSGNGRPGEEIPSIRQLAVSLRVSVITVKRAYLELEREGVILTQQGKGSIVAPNPDLSPRLLRRRILRTPGPGGAAGDLLGLSSDEIARRTKEASNRLNEARFTKETLRKEIV